MQADAQCKDWQAKNNYCNVDFKVIYNFIIGPILGGPESFWNYGTFGLKRGTKSLVCRYQVEARLTFWKLCHKKRYFFLPLEPVICKFGLVFFLNKPKVSVLNIVPEIFWSTGILINCYQYQKKLFQFYSEVIICLYFFVFLNILKNSNDNTYWVANTF